MNHFLDLLIKRGVEKTILKTRGHNWLCIQITLDLPTLVSAGDEREVKLESCLNIIPLS